MALLYSLPSSTKKKKKKKKKVKIEPPLTKLSGPVYAYCNISHYKADSDIAFLGSQTLEFYKEVKVK